MQKNKNKVWALCLLASLSLVGCRQPKIEQPSEQPAEEKKKEEDTRRIVPAEIIPWPEKKMSEAEWNRITSRLGVAEDYIDIATFPKIEVQAEFGKQHPHLTIEGHRIDYDADADWYFYSGTDQKAAWLETSKRDGSAHRILFANTKKIWGADYEFDPKDKVWRKQEKAPPPPVLKGDE